MIRLFVSSGIPSVCKQVVSVETTRDIEWATYTCTLGFQVFGKWTQSLAPSLSLWLLLPPSFSLPSGVCVFLSLMLISPASPLPSSGLWPDGSDGTDINAVCRSNDKSLLVTGDDFGKVHLFTYPCSQFRVRSALPCNTYIRIIQKEIQLSNKHKRMPKLVICFFFPGSQPCLPRPQQSCDQPELPLWRQLPGVDRREGHECDAVADSLSEEDINKYCQFLTELNWTEMH